MQCEIMNWILVGQMTIEDILGQLEKFDYGLCIR